MGQNRGSRPATIGDKAVSNSGPRRTGITQKLKGREVEWQVPGQTRWSALVMQWVECWMVD